MNIEHIVVHKGTAFHSAFPDIIRLQNGELVTIFRQTPFLKGSGVKGDPHEKLTHYHAAPGSRIALVRSTDDGLTWDPKSLVVVDASSGSNDLNMAMIAQSSSGELVAFNFRWIVNLTPEQARARAGRRNVRERPKGHPFGNIAFDSLYLIWSHDQGHTWGEPKPLAFGDLAYASSTGKNGFVELPDGTLLLPLEGTCAGEGSWRTFIARSYDGGRTWGKPSTVAYDPEQRIGFEEPPLLRLPSGKLLTMMRTIGADGYMYQAFSTDDGWTWQGLKRTPMWGHPAHLLYLRSGRVLCAYGYRREPFGVRAVLSEDEGETWDMEHEIVVRDDGMHVDLGYPASVQLKDGRILTVYYFHGRDGVRYISGSIHTEEDALK